MNLTFWDFLDASLKMREKLSSLFMFLMIDILLFIDILHSIGCMAQQSKHTELLGNLTVPVWWLVFYCLQFLIELRRSWGCNQFAKLISKTVTYCIYIRHQIRHAIYIWMGTKYNLNKVHMVIINFPGQFYFIKKYMWTYLPLADSD